MLLGITTDTLEAVMGAAVSTAAPVFMIAYADLNATTWALTDSNRNVGVLNGTSNVVVLPAPSANTRRQVKFLNILNTDTIKHQISVIFNANTVFRTLKTISLDVGQSLTWTPENGWEEGPATFNLNLTGTTKLDKVIIGDAGSEESGVNINGTVFDSSAKVSDIGGTNLAQFLIHRHSTTLSPLIVAARSRSDTSGHSTVVKNDEVLRLIGAGWDGVDYKPATEINFIVDGVSGAGNMPGRIDLKTTPANSISPVKGLSLRQSGRIEGTQFPMQRMLRGIITSRAWTIRTSAANNAWRAIAWSPELGLFAAVATDGTGNRVMTSPDGITWTIRTSAADNQWFAIAWSPELGLFVAMAATGTGNRVMTSPDGITWTIRTSAADNSWFGIAWSPELGLFVAVAATGTGNRVMTSPDGITWTIRTSAADNQWLAIAWSPELGLFAAVANSGTGNRVMTSPRIATA